MTTKTTTERLADLERFAYQVAKFLESQGFDPQDLPAPPPQLVSGGGLSEATMTILEISRLRRAINERAAESAKRFDQLDQTLADILEQLSPQVSPVGA